MTLATLSRLDRLIAFASVSSDGNIELTRWIEAYLAKFGVAARMTFDDSGRKAKIVSHSVV
jgi:acetylornithine deacetylase/succinyl-diaminopimelate desuccinylase-like protein